MPGQDRRVPSPRTNENLIFDHALNDVHEIPLQPTFNSLSNPLDVLKIPPDAGACVNCSFQLDN